MTEEETGGDIMEEIALGREHPELNDGLLVMRAKLERDIREAEALRAELKRLRARNGGTRA